ncbi:MAG: hypothetical protein ACYC61_27310 [Isosphaeraceae bacterium]
MNKHNVGVDALAEWIEGCITFVDDEISQSEIADVLVEENYYRSQDFAKIRIGDAWKELIRRRKCLGDACPYTLAGLRIKRTKPWKRTPAYSFCLMLSLQVSYRPAFTAMFGTDYTEQGILFERLTAEALEGSGWSTHSTGWSKSTANSILDKVEALAGHLGEASCPSAVDRWTDDHAKDGGLDVVCHIPFADRWCGRPVLYVQCASGDNWKDKRATPNIKLWEKLLDLATEPRRGISIPFVLLADEFRREANYDLLSLLLDRHRISAPITRGKKAWLSKPLANALNAWTESRLPALLKAKAS